MEDDLSTINSFLELPTYTVLMTRVLVLMTRFFLGGGGFMSAHVYLSFIMVCARAAPKEGVLLALSCPAFARLLLADLELVGVMEQASCSIMTGIRAFSAHLPLTSLFTAGTFSMPTSYHSGCGKERRILIGPW